MEALTFFSAMNRGQFREEQGIEGSSYCIFFAPMEELVTQDRMTGREDRVVLELLYGVLEEYDMITRSVRVRNDGSAPVRLTRVASACLDFPVGDHDFIT
ncbi:MAG: glycoside hydrolase family 36 N-terminal domain-containing protein, partial [Flavonifractor plautii]